MKGVVSAVLVGAAVASHYEKPPCQADEIAGQLSTGTQLCAPKCDASGGCPTDLPAGVTAQPQCALKTTSGDKYCALVCKEASDCGAGADCTKPVPFMPTGVCTYAAGVAGPTPSQEQTAFEEFGAAFGRFYISAEERLKRFGIFVENLGQIAEMQSQDSSATYSYRTPFADWSKEEFSARNNLDASLFDRAMTDQAPNASNATLPAAFDWVAKGAVNDIKNQAQCGSCWAFSTVANIEGVNFVKTQKLLSLSEQELVDCDTGSDHGCQGGLPSNAFKYMISSKVGLESELKYPYTQKDGKCQAQKADELVFISSWKTISTDETQIAAALMQYGPLSIGINAGPMQLYQGGIADPKNCNPQALDHGVAIVAFGSVDKAYWTIRNSWGTTWGEKGYYRIVRGVGKCGLNTMVTTAIMADTLVVV